MCVACCSLFIADCACLCGVWFVVAVRYCLLLVVLACVDVHVLVFLSFCFVVDGCSLRLLWCVFVGGCRLLSCLCFVVC